MGFNKYTTKELEFITSNFELLTKELEKRHIKELDDFLFKPGDVIYSKENDDNFLLKIKEIDVRNNNVIVEEIVIRNGGSFDHYVDDWFDIDKTDWDEYVKIEDSKIFENLLDIIDQYNYDVQRLNDEAYFKLKNEIANYDC